MLHAGVALLVEKSDNGAPLGIVYMHDLSETHGWAYYREFFPGDLL